MSVGWAKDKASVDNTVGDLAYNLNHVMRRLSQFKTELDAYSDAALTGAGYSTGEVTALRAFASDGQQLATIYSGGAALATAKDFRPSARAMWGILGDS